MIKMVSFDIWDTILKRKCMPEEIKLYTCQYLFFKYKNNLKNEYLDIYKIKSLRNSIEYELSLENEKCGKDKECNIMQVFELLNNKIFKNPIKGIEEELIRIEVEEEKKKSYVNPEIKQILEEYKNYDKICISDFYMSSKYLEEILQYHNVLSYFKKIYSSCDYNFNKKSGCLFRLVMEKEKITEKDILHIGDNPLSDINVPKSLGIKTLKINNDSQTNKIEERILNYKDIIEVKKISTMYDAGKILSIIPYYFMLKIILEENNKGTTNVYYFTREGEFFSEVHKIIRENNYYHTKTCKEQILEVSRMATFSPSINDFSVENLMNIWRQYNKQSLKDLYITLNIDIEKYKKYFIKYDLNCEEKIQNPWENNKFKKLFKDEKYIKEMNNEILIKREELLKYFAEKRIYDDDKSLSVVDIGWRGTIQDNIARIFSKKEITGYYLSLLDFFNAQEKNVNKYSIVREKDFIKEYVGHLITFFEMIFIPDSGSVINYKDGKANRKTIDDEYKTNIKYIKELQHGMLDGVKQLDAYFYIHPYSIDDIYLLFKDIIKKVKLNPPKLLVDAYFNVILNNNFGAGNYVLKNKALSFKEKLNAKKCLALLKNESWKEAFLLNNKLYILYFAVRTKLKLKELIK